jgi:hypothetical protein
MKPKPLHSFYGTVSTLLPFTVLRECKKKKMACRRGRRAWTEIYATFLCRFLEGGLTGVCFYFSENNGPK